MQGHPKSTELELGLVLERSVVAQRARCGPETTLGELRLGAETFFVYLIRGFRGFHKVFTDLLGLGLLWGFGVAGSVS